MYKIMRKGKKRSETRSENRKLVQSKTCINNDEISV